MTIYIFQCMFMKKGKENLQQNGADCADEAETKGSW